jgi:uncharacterized membrane protein
MAQFHVLVGPEALDAPPVVRRISIADLKDALARGFDDFMAMPSHALFLCVIYPVVGVALAVLSFGYGQMSLIFPLAAGFALIGPLAAIGLYALSRQRERGETVDPVRAFEIIHHPSFGAIVALGVLLLAIFAAWIAVAQWLYVSNFGPAPITSFSEFAHNIFNTREGWRVIILGNAIGFVFAVVALTLSVVSFPLLLDRDVGAAEALVTSCRAVWANPFVMAVWGLIVAVALFLGSLPLLVGLAVVLPVLGHATWHLYRKVIAPDPRPHIEDPPAPAPQPDPTRRRYAAQFPASILGGKDHT